MARGFISIQLPLCPALPAWFPRRLRGGVPLLTPSDILGKQQQEQQHFHCIAVLGGNLASSRPPRPGPTPSGSLWQDPSLHQPTLSSHPGMTPAARGPPPWSLRHWKCCCAPSSAPSK